MRFFNRRYAVIRTSGGVRILVEPRNPDDDVVFETQNDVSLFERNRVLYVGGNRDGTGSKKMEAFKLWLESEKRRTYARVVFSPGKKVSKDTYNLFRGYPVPAVEGDWGLLRGHIYENICESNDTYFAWFMTWLSMLFQQPENKPGSTVVITGEKGTGKSTLFDYINQLLGRHGITVSQRKQIVGQFNGHLATTLLMVCEEAFWAADPQAEGVLKDMITNKSVLIEKKGYDPIQSQNYTRLALISNNDWVVPASLKDERRFFVLRCSSARRGDLAFFGAIRKQMEEEGGLEAMMHELMTYEPLNGTFASLYNPPVTAHLQTQQIESLSGIQKFMLELVRSGVYETHDDKVAQIELNEDKETIVPAVDVRSAIEDYVRFRFASDKAKTSYDDISAVVQDWFGAREVKMLVDGQTNKKRMFVFPPLDMARAKLKETKGLDIVNMPEEEIKAIRLR
jgi:energy-coupling factor transporter ATP-binding protein EcfA2